jgi:hypothetical protein
MSHILLIDQAGVLSTLSQPNQHSGTDLTSNKSSSVDKSSSQETQPRVTLEERVSRGEAQTGPTIPLSQVQQQDNESSPKIRQVYPPQNQEQQQNQFQLQSSSSTATEEEPTSAYISSSQQGGAQPKKELTHEEEKKIVDTVLKKLTPLVEQLVAAEVRRVLSGGLRGGVGDEISGYSYNITPPHGLFGVSQGESNRIVEI